MANIDTLNSQLAAVGDAIRAKLETQDTYKISEMPDAIASISGGGEVPQIVLTNQISNLNNLGYYDWLYTDYINNISTNDLLNISYAFSGSGNSNLTSQIEDLSSLIFNFTANSNINCTSAFENNTKIKKLPKIGNNILNVGACTAMFAGCEELTDFGDFGDSTKVSFAQGNFKRNGCFRAMYKVREIPSLWLKDMVTTSTNTSSFSHPYYLNFDSNYNVDKYENIGVSPLTLTSNMFNRTFTDSYCCKKVTFDTNNGIPYTVQWKSQVINLYQLGYVVGGSSSENKYIIPVRGVGKKVYDAASYEALKNDPDWYTLSPSYSKYNHDSAVETINSLPDTSAYITTVGGTNTIQFKDDLGSATDGGAISTLTNEEIAVATAKGWTVTIS